MFIAHNKLNLYERTPHDEAFKKLLESFFAEFVQLFFPEVHELIDYGHLKFLQQEIWVDVIGEDRHVVDVLVETKLKDTEALIIVHVEPQSYEQADFNERMFLYFSRLYEKYRKDHRLIVPIALFTYDKKKDEPDTLMMALPELTILQFRFLKVELKKRRWRDFVHSDNPVAAALLCKMDFNKDERIQVRATFLRMMLRMKVNEAQKAMMLSFFDLYLKLKQDEENLVLKELRQTNPGEEAMIMELMNNWQRKGYEAGLEAGRIEGKEEGREEGELKKAIEVARNLLELKMSVSEIAKITGLPEAQIEKLRLQ